MHLVYRKPNNPWVDSLLRHARDSGAAGHIEKGSDGAREMIGVLKRNGLSQTAGVDYTYTNGRATPKIPWSTDDIVVADEITLFFP